MPVDAQVLARLAETCVAIEAPITGILTWEKKKSDGVMTGDAVATVLGTEGLDEGCPTEATARCKGSLKAIVASGYVNEGQVIGFVEPEERSWEPPPPHSRADRYRELDLPRTVASVPASTEAGTKASSDASDTASKPAPAAPPALLPALTPATIPLTDHEPIRIEPETYYLATDQKEAVLQDAEEFQAELGYSLQVSKSEIARVALELYRALPRSERLAKVRENREAERDMGIGAGAKRGRPPGKKNTSTHYLSGSRKKAQERKTTHARQPTQKNKLRQ